MLLRYNVTNFKSFGDTAEFSLLPPEDRIQSPEMPAPASKTIKTKAGPWEVLQCGGLFGPNGAGKTTFIESIDFASRYLVEGRRPDSGTGVPPFKGADPQQSEPSTFQFVFYQEGEVYDYGFSLNQTEVQQEWLFRLENDGFEMLFSRPGPKGSAIEIGESFLQDGSAERALAELLKNSLWDNQLYLYKLFENRISEAVRVLQWFRRVQVIYPSTTVHALPAYLKEHEDVRDYMEEMLSILDTGIRKISVKSTEVELEDLVKNPLVPSGLADQWAEVLEQIDNGIVTISGKCFLISKDADRRSTLEEVKFEHLLNSRHVELDLEEESSGTRRIIDFVPMMYSIGINDTLYFVDEMDRSLHTKLTQYLVRSFRDRAGQGENQLVFTAQDVSLLNLEAMSHEEIWFIEKTGAGVSDLYPMTSFGLKSGQDTLQAYLLGRFGAVPYTTSMMSATKSGGGNDAKSYMERNEDGFASGAQAV